MNIKSVLDLKEEVLQDVTKRDDGNPDIDVAIGVAPTLTARDFKVAIRLAEYTAIAVRWIDRISRLASGEVDVRITGRRVASESFDPLNTERVRPMLTIGSSVGHYRSTAGTLGFFARSIEDGTMGFVSCNHIIAAADAAGDGDDILSPAPSDGGRRPRDIVGHLDGRYPRLHTKPSLDCAFARIAENVCYDAATLQADRLLLNDVSTPDEYTVVEKIGRTSGHTRGRITAFQLDSLDVYYPFGKVGFQSQIEITSDDSPPFCRPGDSGALLFSPDHRPLGLLVASARFGAAYAHPLEPILRSLNIRIAV